MERCVHTRFTLLFLAVAALLAAPASVADLIEVLPGSRPHHKHRPANKFDDVIFVDGFELGDTSAWSNGTASNDCRTTLIIPTGLTE